jgi:hypothetical protein
MTFSWLSVIGCALFFLTADGSPSLADDVSPRFVMPGVDEFWAIIERPLLSRSRRPAEDAPAEGDSAAIGESSPAATLMLVGTATDQRARTVAVLRNGSDATEFRVWVGDTVGGWKVKGIQPRTLLLVSEGSEVTITLDDPVLPEAPAHP